MKRVLIIGNSGGGKSTLAGCNDLGFSQRPLTVGLDGSRLDPDPGQGV